MDDALALALKQPFAEQLAFFRQKLGNLIPTEWWTDVVRAGHDTGFMVAGAQGADLLAGLAAAMDKAEAQGTGIEAFRKDFRSIVEREGWAYRGEFNWRTRTIYVTNMATSYSAGRYAQLMDGDFEFWTYHHSRGELHPRPMHVSWDGITVPRGHPFIATHYTPNGFGCECYWTGSRSLEEARRMGAVPAKPLPEGWNTIDPETGSPPGVGKGWNYEPGDTVSEAVNQMAGKSVHWPYTIARAYMQNVPADVRDRLAVAYRKLPSVADDARRYAQRILAGRTDLDIQPYQTLGLVTAEQAAEINKITGEDVTAFDFALDRNAPGHIRNDHGDPAFESPRGQAAVNAADYADVPELINSGTIAPPREDYGDPAFELSGIVNGRRITTIWVVWAGRRKMLNLKTMWISAKKAADGPIPNVQDVP